MARALFIFSLLLTACGVEELQVLKSGATRIAGAPDGEVIVAGSYLFGEVYIPWLGRLSGG